MSFTCPFCYSYLGNRSNIFGTICYKCGNFIENKEQIPLILKMRNKLISNQILIRKFLRKKILGDINGDKVEQKDRF